jgi:hypothetical protein
LTDSGHFNYPSRHGTTSDKHLAAKTERVEAEFWTSLPSQDTLAMTAVILVKDAMEGFLENAFEEGVTE